MSFLQYFGLDWLAIGLSLLAVFLLGNQNKLAFITFMVANVIWIVLGLFLLDSYGIAIGNMVFFLLNSRGFWTWNRKNHLKAPRLKT